MKRHVIAVVAPILLAMAAPGDARAANIDRPEGLATTEQTADVKAAFFGLEIPAAVFLVIAGVAAMAAGRPRKVR